MNWFSGLDVEIKVAIISAGGAILAAAFNGLFSLLTKRKGSDTKSTSVNQKTKGNNNTVIGIQNDIRNKDK